VKKLINGMAMAATAITGLTVATAPATAQSPTYAERHYGTPPYNYDSAMRDYRRELRNYRRWNRYDYNNPDPRYGAYYADRYYRDGRYYRQRQLSYDDRVYRGYDNRYYCRRSDGTTGLIVGGIAGGLIGNAIAPGDSKTLGTILGAGAGALAGQAIDRNSVRCR